MREWGAAHKTGAIPPRRFQGPPCKQSHWVSRQGPTGSADGGPHGQQTGAHRVSRQVPTGSADGAHRVSRRGPTGSADGSPQGQQTGAHQAGQPSPEPTAAPLRPAQQEKRCQTKRHATHTHTHTHTIRAGHTLSHLNYPLNRSVLTSSERGTVRPWPTARENRPHRLTPPPRYAHPRLRSWALPTSEGWPAVPAACGPSSDPADTDVLGCQCPLMGPSTSPHLPQADGPSSSSSACLTEESPCTSCDPCSGPRGGR